MANGTNSIDRSTLALSFTAGGVVGAVVAILFAPSEGRQTREKIKEIAVDVKGKTGQLSTDLKEKAASFLEKRKETREANEEVPQSDFVAVKNEYASEGGPSLSLGES